MGSLARIAATPALPLLLLAQAQAAPLLDAAALPGSGASEGPGVFRVVASLLVVLAALALFGALLRKSSLAGRAGELAVESRIPVTRGGHLAIVRAGERRLLVGVTGAQVSLIAELDEATRAAELPKGGRFDTLLSGILKRPGGAR